MSRFIQKYCLLLIIIIELVCSANTKWGGNRWKQVLEYDGKGYNAYLPAVFIYKDLQFSFFEEIENKYSGPRTFYDYRVPTNSGTVNKYFAGTALVTLPFFISAHMLTLTTGGITDGYSFFYQISISIASIFYGFIGLFYLRKLLKSYSFSDNTVTLVLLATGLSTHLFYYTVYEPSMSHVYSFAFITIFIFQAKKFFDTFKSKHLLFLGLLLGIITLIRPVNALVIFIIPFIAGSFQNLNSAFQVIRNKIGIVLLSVLLAVTVISFQGWIYYVQSGKFFIDSYNSEKFFWNRPEIINILFSYRKGLFIYTPAAFISMAGLFTLYKKNRFATFSFIFFFLLITYVFSCWCSWWYGGSFSSRPYVEYLSLFGILLAFLISGLKKKIQWITTCSLLVFCTILGHVQFYQYRYFILHWEKMDKEHYWRIFMRIDQLARHENPNSDL